MLETKAMLAVIIFVCIYAIIITEKVQRTIIALFGAMLMVISGLLTQEQAISYIDFNTLGLLTGMMILVNITAETGLFDFLAVWAVKKVKADPLRLLLALATLTAVCSAFLDNVTTVLLTIPITFSITSQLKLPVYPYLAAQILASNIGGTATLIGDPPNIMIGSAVKKLDFMSFLTNLGAVCVIIFIVTVLLIAFIYRKKLHTKEELKADVMALDENTQIRNLPLMKKCLFVLFITVVGFVFHSALGLESATIAISGACLLMLSSMHAREEVIAKVLSRLEWLSIFFFAGLFILVGGLVETGVINLLAEKVISLTQGNLNAAAMFILWVSAIASSFIDNIPFVATMIPLIKDMGSMGMTNSEPLWWALSLGACLGGNGTIIGASANVVVSGMAAQHGHPIKFIDYMKLAFPLMILSIIISSIYIYLRYLL